MNTLLKPLAVAAMLIAMVPAHAAQQWTDEEQASGVKKIEMVRYAFAGQKMKLQLLYAMDLDCSTIDG
jgi:hypothetical protein